MAGADFSALFAELRALMLDAAGAMTVAKDEPGRLELNAAWAHPRKPKEPMWFGGVRAGRAYVSFHLMPLYTQAGLLDAVSPALRRRMQGKSCFNFTTADPAQLAELAALTRRCAEAYAVKCAG